MSLAVEVALENPTSMEKGRHWKSAFRERFCEVYKCDPARFEEAVFWRTLHLHAWFPAKWLYRRNPAMFREDLDFIREIGGIDDPLIFKSEVNRFHGRNVRERGWLRGTFHIRVSARRVIKLKNRLFRLAS
jgi:hypothetical protein